MTRRTHLVVTDSGLGGLAVCAGIEQALRQHAVADPPRITYVNAWPEEGRGYNDLPDMPARAAAFDRALSAIDAMRPDRVVIACNTLSIVYQHTAHARRSALPVHGIVEAGVELFASALRERPSAALVLIGTRTTIESGAHALALRALGLGDGRVSGASCHGLATAIEAAASGPRTDDLLATCCAAAASVAPLGEPLFVGLCCTHYGLIAPRLARAMAREARREVVTLDPNARLAQDVVRRLGQAQATAAGDAPQITVTMVSKVRLDDAKRQNVARLVEDMSPATARALRDCAHVPDLF